MHQKTFNKFLADNCPEYKNEEYNQKIYTLLHDCTSLAYSRGFEDSKDEI